MAHVPHLLIAGQWEGDRLEVSEPQRLHLERVLRLSGGAEVTYTDGEGSVGVGRYLTGLIDRGQESSVPRPTDLTMVCAPPDSRDRARFLVEKLAELGVAELAFLTTRYGEGRPPKEERLRSWAVSGLEQSRGGWLMRTSARMLGFPDLKGALAVCDPDGSPQAPPARTVVIGPEGGWARGEVPEDAFLYRLGEPILRVETAALVAAARMA